MRQQQLLRSFPRDATAAAGMANRAWFAAYTCANHEKRVVEHFEARAVEHFLPLYSSVRRWKRPARAARIAIFPGYVFVRIAVGARLRVLEVPGVVRLVGFNGHLILFRTAKSKVCEL